MRIITAVILIIIVAGTSFAQDCYKSSIVSPSPFMGNHGEIFKLSDGSLWEVKNEHEYLYEYYPNVIICPSKGYLAIAGKTLTVEPVAGRKPSKAQNTRQTPPAIPAVEVIESYIDGTFSGWSGETIFRLTNGQIWQQSVYAYTYTYKYRPKVIIIRVSGGYEMQVDGMDSRVRVVRIK